MIKDSKLIGTKIAAPFGWKKFKVGELFDYVSIRQIPSYFDSLPGDIPYLAQTSFNNSTSKYISHTNDLVLNKGKAIVVGVDTQYATYQDISFYANKMIALYLSNRYNGVSLTSYLGLYFCCIFNKKFLIYDYNRKLSLKRLLSLCLNLPVTADNQPDFEWMSAYIKAVKADYLEQKELSNQNEIKAYLSAGNIDSMDVTDDDRQFLRDFEKLPRRKFKVGELFDFKSSMSLNKSDLTFVSRDNPFAIPYITRTVLNNGINGYVDSRLVDNEYINSGNEFAFGLLGLTAFYQCNNYCTGQFVKRFVPKFKLTELSAMFFKTLIDRQIEVFKTVSIRSYNQLINDTLEIDLPVIDSSQVDVDSIEKYMQIQIKLTIAKRQQLLDQRLQLAKTV